MIDWPLTFSTISKALEAVKMLRDTEKSFDEASFKLKIADLSSLADLKIALIDAQSETTEKDAEIAKLREAFAFRENKTVVVRGRRFEATPDRKPQGMPYCHRCEVVDGRLVRLSLTSSKDGNRAICPQCKADYGRDRGYLYPPPTKAEQNFDESEQ